MIPTTTITTITYHEFKSTPQTTVEIAPSRPLPEPATFMRDLRRAEVIGWLTQQLDWEDHLDRLRDKRTEHGPNEPRPYHGRSQWHETRTDPSAPERATTPNVAPEV